MQTPWCDEAIAKSTVIIDEENITWSQHLTFEHFNRCLKGGVTRYTPRPHHILPPDGERKCLTTITLIFSFSPFISCIVSVPWNRKVDGELSGSNVINFWRKRNSWTYNFAAVSGHKLESSQTWGSRWQWLHYKPVSNHFCSRGKGEGGKLLSRGDCE